MRPETALIHSWKDIKGKKTCPGCHHSRKAHLRLDGLSELLDVDIWTCLDCTNEGRACTRRGTVATGPGGHRRTKEPYSRKL